MTMREPISEQARPSLEQAITAARAGQRDDAVHMLRQVIADDPRNADAWMWLGGTAPDPREQRNALERAVELAPHNRRAQRGLEWLRETQPQVFEETDRSNPTEQSTTGQTATTETPAALEEPRQAQTISPQSTTPPRQEASVTDQASRPEETQPEQADATGAVIYEQPRTEQPADGDVLQDARTVRRVETQPSVHDRATQPMTTQPARMPAAATAAPRPFFVEERRSEETVLPPPEAVPEYERAPGANVARWLTIMLWCLGLGVTATFAAIAIASQPTVFQQTLQNLLVRVGAPSMIVSDLAALRPVLIGVAIAVAVIDFWMIIGLVLRQRWAWGVELLVALLITAGAIALLVPYFVTPGLVPGTLTTDNPAVLTIAGLIGFGVIFLLLTLASRRAFRRPPSEETYGRE